MIKSDFLIYLQDRQKNIQILYEFHREVGKKELNTIDFMHYLTALKSTPIGRDEFGFPRFFDMDLLIFVSKKYFKNKFEIIEIQSKEIQPGRREILGYV